MNKNELAALFARLGAPDPSSWAASQLDEGIPQLARFLFLRQAWKQVVPEDDASWMDAFIAVAEKQPNGPYAGVGHALRSLRARGATNEELTDLVRGMQAELLFSFCYLLSDPGDLEVEDVGWALVQVDRSGKVGDGIECLHESVLEMDPTGREMRPRREAG